ncbi:MAG: hypothetical protein IJK77_05885 [Lachnospiraceae bacterium]|nr:hypothetical protein [Lachnospiraceae bacterium]
MAYTALEKMRKVNRERFGTDVGPFEPELYGAGNEGNDLRSAALRFLHERCEGLRFSPEKTRKEERTGQYLGTGLARNQIPYDMQMDIDRLCLERELENFIGSGVAEDAYTVYYSFLRMFLGTYAQSSKMIELLSEFESNASTLLMKHRDHYSHSVYVFALGLAIYETNEQFRRTFQTFYGFEPEQDEHAAAAFFLEYWGLTSLFHDIGYPFEIPFEQVLAYFEVDRRDRGPGSLYLAYRDLDCLTGMSSAAKKHFSKLMGRPFDSVEALLAYGIEKRLGEAYGVLEDYLLDTIRSKPTEPERFGYFMDHAYFSATRLYQELAEVLGAEALTEAHVDALTAIMLHNSMFKFAIAFYKDKKKRRAPLKAELHPLAFLLMLCDELQCWDRTAYGRNSRTELHPMDAEFDLSRGMIHALYCFDAEESEKIGRYEEEYRAWEQNGSAGDPPRLKAFSDMAEKEQRFRTDIEKIVDLSDYPLFVATFMRTADRKSKHTYLSGSSFLHMYDFAVAINGRYRYEGKEDGISAEQLERDFDEMSLEYQLSNINQVKNFAKYLNAIDCFYTDRPVDFEMLRSFTEEQCAVFAPMEHARWVRAYRAMGWTAGNLYETAALDEDTDRAALREQMRQHKLCINGDFGDLEIARHYLQLPEADQGKDWKPFNSMLKLIRKFDGLRIYKLD